MGSNLSDVAQELYALAPDEFTAARNDRARDAAGQDKELAGRIRELRKPSAAAWAVNMMARHRADMVAQILDLGASLREAQEDLDAGELRELGRQRQQLIAVMVTQARALAEELGHPIGEAAATEVGQTLQAAMADPDAADAVRTGLLTRALVSSGWGPAELSDAVALPPEPPPDAKVTQISERQRVKAARRLEDAERGLADAERKAQDLEGQRKELEQQRTSLAGEREELTEQLADIERELASADREAESIDRQRTKAANAVEAAEAAVEEAREELDRLR